MKLYVVFFENGKIYAIYSNKSKALKEVDDLQNIYYENATMKEYKLEH